MFLTAQGGFLGPFAWLLGKIMNLIYNLLADSNGIANLGVCIILFTIVIKVVLVPFTLKQQKSVKINMMIQPEIKKIQKKYNGKKDEKSMLMQQKEMKEVYEKYGTSMTGGCLTSLIQLPIMFALYRVVQNIPAYVEKVYDMYNPIASGMLEAKGDKIQEILINYVNENNISSVSYAISKFKDLTEIKASNIIDVLSNLGLKDLNALLETLNLSSSTITESINNLDKIYNFAFGINIAESPGFNFGLPLLVPVLSAFFQWLSMKVTSSGQQQDMDGNDMSASMMKAMGFMPIFSLFITINLPVAIGIYWMMSSLITVITQLLINYYYDHIVDQEAMLEKQMEIAKIKNAKKKNKPSLYDRLMDQQSQLQEELEKQEAMKKNSSKSLKNYVSAESSNNNNNENRKREYKKDSIGAKANIMMNYNSSNDNKEEK